MSSYTPSSSGYRLRPSVGYAPEERALDRLTRDVRFFVWFFGAQAFASHAPLQAEQRMSKIRQTRDEARAVRLEQLERKIRSDDDAKLLAADVSRRVEAAHARVNVDLGPIAFVLARRVSSQLPPVACRNRPAPRIAKS